MKSFLTTLFSVFLAGLGQAADKPNIIFILLDDLGKEWVSCYGAENIETKHIDALAASGMKFNNAYSMPQCTPSRVCFLTGQYPFRNGWINHWDTPRWGEGYFDWEKYPSIGRAMKNAGYATAAAGKWQINDFRVTPDAMVKHGFDDYCMWTGYEAGNPPSANRYWDPYIHTKEGSKTYPGKFGPDIYHKFVLDFISAKKDQPFFVYFPMALPHTPFVHTPLHPEAKTKMEKHRAMVLYVDFLLGKLVAHLKDLGLREKTLIVFTTDNGTTGALKNSIDGRWISGGKTKTTENGVNAPFIVSMPSMVPAGKTSDALVDFSDMYPTFLDFAGGKPEEGFVYDGTSAKEVFLGKKEDSDRKFILAMGSHPAVHTDKGVENTFYFRDRVLREKKVKLFVDVYKRPVKLVDLSKDPEEKENLLDDPAYKELKDSLVKMMESLPRKDADPVYRKRAANAWDISKGGKNPYGVKRNLESQTHKLAQPSDSPPPIKDPVKKGQKKKK